MADSDDTIVGDIVWEYKRELCFSIGISDNRCIIIGSVFEKRSRCDLCSIASLISTSSIRAFTRDELVPFHTDSSQGSFYRELVFFPEFWDDIEINIAHEAYQALIDHHDLYLTRLSLASMISQGDLTRYSFTIFVYGFISFDLEISFFF